MLNGSYAERPEGDNRKVVLEGQTVHYRLRKSSKAKHIRLEVRAGFGLTVVVPGRLKPDSIHQILENKKRWILRNLRECQLTRPLPGAVDTSVIPYLGRKLDVVVEHNGQDDGVRLEGNRLIVSLRPNSMPGIVVEAWYRRMAEAIIRERVENLSQQLGVSHGRVSVRNARTRWGSCSQKGNLSFNWKLIIAPDPVVDYVIIHELAHRKEMNHSKKFWGLVERYCPDWRRHKAWLRDHQAYLATRLLY